MRLAATDGTETIYQDIIVTIAPATSPVPPKPVMDSGFPVIGSDTIKLQWTTSGNYWTEIQWQLCLLYTSPSPRD